MDKIEGKLRLNWNEMEQKAIWKRGEKDKKCDRAEKFGVKNHSHYPTQQKPPGGCQDFGRGAYCQLNQYVTSPPVYSKCTL